MQRPSSTVNVEPKVMDTLARAYIRKGESREGPLLSFKELLPQPSERDRSCKFHTVGLRVAEDYLGAAKKVWWELSKTQFSLVFLDSPDNFRQAVVDAGVRSRQAVLRVRPQVNECWMLYTYSCFGGCLVSVEFAIISLYSKSVDLDMKRI